MKPILILIALWLVPCLADAGVRITLNVTPSPSPYLSDWVTRRETIMLTITNDGPDTRIVKLDAQVFLDGRLQARTNRDRMATLSIRPGIHRFNGEDLVPARAVTFVGDIERQVVRSGRLPSGTYRLCVSVSDAATGESLAPEQCSPLRIQSYRAPTPMTPANGAKIPPPRIRPTFEWTSVSPQYSPRQRYEIRVAEVRDGQKPEQAFRANRPILERTRYASTRLEWPAEVRLDTPMVFVWSVRALDDAGNPMGETEGGWSLPRSFSLGSPRGGGRLGFVERARDQGGTLVPMLMQEALGCPMDMSTTYECTLLGLTLTWTPAGNGPFLGSSSYYDATSPATYWTLTIDQIVPGSNATGSVQLMSAYGNGLSAGPIPVTGTGDVGPSGLYGRGLCITPETYPFSIVVRHATNDATVAPNVDIALYDVGLCPPAIVAVADSWVDANGVVHGPGTPPAPRATGCILFQ